MTFTPAYLWRHRYNPNLELGWVACPGNNCGDPLEVEHDHGRIVTWPNVCKSCKTHLHLPPEGPIDPE